MLRLLCLCSVLWRFDSAKLIIVKRRRKTTCKIWRLLAHISQLSLWRERNTERKSPLKHYTIICPGFERAARRAIVCELCDRRWLIKFWKYILRVRITQLILTWNVPASLEGSTLNASGSGFISRTVKCARYNKSATRIRTCENRNGKMRIDASSMRYGCRCHDSKAADRHLLFQCKLNDNCAKVLFKYDIAQKHSTIFYYIVCLWLLVGLYTYDLIYCATIYHDNVILSHYLNMS